MGKRDEWGFTPDSWKGQRGEYWVVAQGVVLIGFVLLPVWRPTLLDDLPTWVTYGRVAAAIAIGGLALLLMGKGVFDLGENLTPLPYPREEGQLVQTGVYGLVRHCLYSGLILGMTAISLWLLSLPHFAAVLVLFLVLDAKARQEEAWLLERHPEYADYRQRVKKLIPWIY